jgi:hypothetical protein
LDTKNILGFAENKLSAIENERKSKIPCKKVAKTLFYEDETVFWWKNELERVAAGVFEV